MSSSRSSLITAFLLIAAAAVVFLQHTAGLPFYRTVPISSAAVSPPEQGLAYSASGRALVMELRHLHPQATVTEDGRPLLFRRRVSEDVRTQGAGRYAFSGKNVWFASSDGSDPRGNGRHYAVIFPARVPYPLVAAAWISLAAGMLLLIRARTGTWVWTWWRGQARLPFRESTRQTSLDVLRALAVILVLFRHGDVCPAAASQMLHQITTVLQRGGWIGVDLFFVLSGYLVSGLLFEEYLRTKRLRVGRFLWRRALKIYPAFWVMLLVTLIAASFGFVPQISIDGLVGELFFIQNYVGNIWMHTWTLAVEEHFYLLLAFMFLLAVENGRDQSKRFFPFVPRAFVTLAIICLAIRCLRHLYLGPAAHVHFASTHVRLDALMCGVWLRHWQEQHPERFLKFSANGTVRWFLASLLLFTPCFLFDHSNTPWITSVGFTVNYFAAACLLVSSRSWELRWPGFNTWTRPLAAIGRHSYSIYLWHVIVEHWLAGPLYHIMAPSGGSPGYWFVYALVYFGGSIGFGILLGKAIEQPVLHLRDRLFPSQPLETDAHLAELERAR